MKIFAKLSGVIFDAIMVVGIVAILALVATGCGGGEAEVEAPTERVSFCRLPIDDLSAKCPDWHKP